MDREVGRLLAVLDAAYDRRSWHGTNLRGSIRGLTARRASWRPAPRRHNVWEIVVHAAYWKYVACRRITGAPRGSFARPGSNWFARGDPADERGWRDDVALLDATHATLRDLVARLSRADLDAAPRGSGVTTFALVSGVAAHDLYHAGQIQLLKRLQK